MALTDLINNSPDFVTGGLIGALLGAALVLGILIFIAIYVYSALAWQTIAKKQKYKNPWFAWVPFLNLVLLLEMGGFHWALIFLLLVPILGWIAIIVLTIIAIWRIFEKAKYPGWFSLASLIPKVGGILFLIALGFVAWKPKK